LLLPESLKQLPLLALALSKSTLFNNITEIHPDVRASAMMLFRTLPVELGVKFLYPTLYRIYPLDVRLTLCLLDVYACI
jgi:protein transport protein SEC24